ncbi:MAG: branched-chain amino acid ABC transporter permease [Acidimicrobiales bacterium]|nr:branched-chain amino acid ABC transporter permease [Acidimicrobiales bacterium]
MSTLGMLAQAGTGATFLQTLVKAVALGCVYMIMGLGFVIIFKGTQVLNFAAGALSMTGAMVLTILVADGGLPFLPLSNPLAPDEGVTPGIPQWLLNVGLALLIAALIGLVVERIAIRPMVGQPLFAMAVITLGVELAIRPFNLDATALTGRSLNVPWGAESWEVAGAIVPKSYVAAMIFAAVAGVAVVLFYRSRLGVAMRAVAFDQEAAMAQGIDVGRVFAIAWALGVALAALGGIVYGMAPFPPGGSVSQEVHPILAFRVLPVIVLGGLDSVIGAVYGGLMIAAAEVFAGQYLADYGSTLGPGYSTIVPYIVMMIVLIVRPFGLFGTPEIRRV